MAHFYLVVIMLSLIGCAATETIDTTSHVSLGEQARQLMLRMERITDERRLNIQERHKLRKTRIAQMETLVTELNDALDAEPGTQSSTFDALAQNLKTSVQRMASNQGTLAEVRTACNNCHKQHRSQR